MDDRLTLETVVKRVKESKAIKQQQTVRHNEAIEVDGVRKGASTQPHHPKMCLGKHLHNHKYAPDVVNQLMQRK